MVPAGNDALAVFLVSFVVCAVIILTKDLHIGAALRRNDTRAVQAAHRAPTPRIGGVAFFAGLVAGTFLVPDEALRIPLLTLVSLMPVFLAGLAEDLGFFVKPILRLLAAAGSAALMVWNFDMWLPRLGVPILDGWMAWAPFGVAVTIFCSAGVCNAFNLIDGVNGLAGCTGVAAALGLCFIALDAGLALHAEFALILVAALMGFLAFNYPWGRIFLGDAGAYALGHVLAWLAIAMIVRIEDLSPWAVLLVFFWPVADTLLAIYRRSRAGRPAGQPDRLHFHQLVMRALEIILMGRQARGVTNPLTTLVLLPMIVAPAATGVILWNAPLAAFIATVMFAVLFVATYLTGVTLARRRALGPLRRRAVPRRMEPAE